MKTVIFCMLLLLSLGSAAQQYPDFKALRFDEDYRFLQKDTTANNWYKSLKFMPINASGDMYLGFGGDLRYQYFYEENGNWGDGPKDSDGYVLGRYLLHADFHAGNYIRAFFQIQGSNAEGRIDPSPVDSNPLEVHQAFAEVRFVDTADKKALFRVGRQELTYGSQRLVSVREGPNNRQSFDAVKMMASKGNYAADLFYSRYVVADDGIFDDASGNGRQFWGSYFVAKNVPLLRNTDWYYFGYRRAGSVFDDAQGIEKRHSVGTRWWGNYGNWRYDAEGVFQFGSMAQSDIEAWTVSLNAGYRFATVPLRPEIGLKGEIISGDKHTADGKLGTFNPLFPRGAYFGLASVIGPSNLVDLHPSVRFRISDKIEWIVDYDIFWRHSANDGIYAPNTALIYPGNTSDAKKIGTQLETDVVFEPNQYLYFRLEATWFGAGPYLKDSSAGKDIFFAGATMQLHF